MASDDLVTGLDARATWQPAVEALAGRSEPYAIAMCDVVGLKAVNESAGFRAGDVVLRAAADRLRAAAAEHRGAAPEAIAAGTMRLGRLGGDEFVAVCGGAGAEAAAAAVAAALAAPGHPPLRSAALAARPGEPPLALIDRLYAILRAS
jgi:GGDEF domain-containing protein